MIEHLIEMSICNRWLVVVAGLLLALAGLYAVYHTPVDAIPDLSENQIIVFTEWPGHSPPEIEGQVTYPLSLHLQGLAGVRVVRSSSDFNFSMISIIFEDGVDAATARERVAQRLTRARAALPSGVVPDLAPDAAATGQIFWYTVEGNGSDLARLRAVQDWYVRPQLSSVPGVAEVASVGGQTGEYAVEVDPRRLQALGVRLSDVLQAVTRGNAAVGGDVIHKANAEYIVHGVGWLGQSAGEDREVDAQRVLDDLGNILVPSASGGSVRLKEVATVALSPAPRRGVLEKDGNEVTGGVVLMRQGENALEVTRRLRDKIQELQGGLPPGVRIVPFYDRTPLIRGAIGTVTGTLVEAMLTATVCVLLVLLHFRTSFVIALTLPLAALASFLLMWLLRWLGIADIQTNIMSLAGIAISIGVLVDSSIVMAENVMHRLHEEFGDRPVTGDVRPIVLSACRTVGRPMFFSVVIMLLSFLPVFALGGIEGKMFRPLAFTKCFALVTVAVLSVTLVPALCTVFIRGRLRGEMDSWLVRGVILAYRPMLAFVLDHPVAIVWFVGVTFLVGLAPLTTRWVWLGYRWAFLLVLALAVLGSVYAARRTITRIAVVLSLAIIAIVAQDVITPLGYEPITPLDEGMIMDMPITVPWASVAQAADDLKARDMLFCRFPEVDMVVGKAGRAETSTDPAPLDMIETMVNFRPPELWPRRKLRPADAERLVRLVLDALTQAGLMANPGNEEARAAVVNEAMMAVLPMFDAQMREYAYQRNLEFENQLGSRLIQAGRARLTEVLRENGSLKRNLSEAEKVRLAASERRGELEGNGYLLQLARDLTPQDVVRLVHDSIRRLQEMGYLHPGSDPLRYRPGLLARAAGEINQLLGGTGSDLIGHLHDQLSADRLALWREHVQKLNSELPSRASPLFLYLVVEELSTRATVLDSEITDYIQKRRRGRLELPTGTASEHHHHAAAPQGDRLANLHFGMNMESGHEHVMRTPTIPPLAPPPALERLQEDLKRRLATQIVLWPAERSELAGPGGELDRAMQMPGWTNVWTMPIQNRVDMLSTGVNTTVGVRILGRRLEDVIRVSEDVARVVARVPGAANVVADRLRGKGYLQIRPDRERAARLGVSVADVNELVEVALGGRVVTQTVEGRERHAVRVRYPRVWRADEETARDLPVRVLGAARPGGATGHVRLADVADVRIAEGPATIKSENGLLRNYVRLNVRGRDGSEFVEEARRAVAAQVELPPGTYLEWTGQFEHEERASTTLLLILPVVIGLIFVVLWLTYHDLADAVLMMLAVPGALAGGLFAQWLFGYKFSVTVWVGYIACFGMATATGIIMLVYLRESVERAGGLEKLTLAGLRQAVLDGAVHRLRPKLLTECTMIFGLAPLLWSSGVGAEVIRPMVLPVLGGILVADEVIDLFLPVLFYEVRRFRWRRLHPAVGSAKEEYCT
jgi:Cu(I)/Ag(I) efflux system membrane protein CusA/SilA